MASTRQLVSDEGVGDILILPESATLFLKTTYNSMFRPVLEWSCQMICIFTKFLERHLLISKDYWLFLQVFHNSYVNLKKSILCIVGRTILNFFLEKYTRLLLSKFVFKSNVFLLVCCIHLISIIYFIYLLYNKNITKLTSTLN